MHCYSRLMRTRTAGLLVLSLITGWGLGWVSRDHWGPEPQADRVASAITPPASWGVPLPSSPVEGERADRGDAFLPLLESNAYARAVERYETLQAQADDATVQRARGQLLEHARRLIGHADYSSATRLLQLYLQIDYRDVEARSLLAGALRGHNDLHAAIGQLYEAKGQAWRPETLEELTRSIRAVVAEAADALKQRGDTAGLLELYQDLTRLEPSYAPYFIGLATAQLALDDLDAARQSLLLVAQVGLALLINLEAHRYSSFQSDTPLLALDAGKVDSLLIEDGEGNKAQLRKQGIHSAGAGRKVFRLW